MVEHIGLTCGSHEMEHKRHMETRMCRPVLMDECVGLTCSSHGRAHERPINDVLVMEKTHGQGGANRTWSKPGKRQRLTHKGEIIGYTCE